VVSYPGRYGDPASTYSCTSPSRCGSADDDSEPATFERDTFPFTFEYPDEFEFTDDVSANGSSAAATLPMRPRQS
jgi:hypothetical protein